MTAALVAAPWSNIDLKSFDPAATCGFPNRQAAEARLKDDIERLASLQEKLYADGTHAVLIIIQGMDTAGKDSVIKHVMTGVNPQGITVTSFTTPTATEEAHDFLWRSSQVLPARGRIAIFNRSYYEEVTIARVHPALLDRERLPRDSTRTDFWSERFSEIIAFEHHLARSGTLVLKFFLHLSREKQRKRLLERIDRPEKRWKFAAADGHERAYWDEYQAAYGEMLTFTSTDLAPWYVIPADHKWVTHAVVADIVVARVAELGLTYPQPTAQQRAAIADYRKTLLA